MSIGALVGGSGVAAANTSASQDRQLWVENGQFETDLDNDALDKNKYNALIATVEEFNQAIENGHVSLEGNASEGISTASNDQTESKVVDIQASPSKIAGGDE
ncbi:hypothetical protein [Halostagnicola kamekurae]|uniref:hypothetical protein n=1 Tax=Halostagnicola kamekurae TaxID=619731 RepID=UPI001113413F|nr:hypothetical protein [Halostagnicola kamekurae]